jgi:hypothetical protein
MCGFNECLNVSIATGLVLQHLLHMCPEARGDLSDGRRCARRAGAALCPAAAGAARRRRCSCPASCLPMRLACPCRAQLREEWYTKLARTAEQQQLLPAYLQQPPPPLDDMRLG